MIETYVIGHLGQDCRIGEVNGKKVINFSLAHTEKYKDQNQQTIEKTIWIDCAYWNNNTKIAEFLKKGTHLFVRGVPSVRTYKNHQGIIMPQLSLRVDYVKLLGSVKQLPGQHEPKRETSDTLHSAHLEPKSAEEELEDDLPF